MNRVFNLLVLLFCLWSMQILRTTPTDLSSSRRPQFETAPEPQQQRRLQPNKGPYSERECCLYPLSTSLSGAPSRSGRRTRLYETQLVNHLSRYPELVLQKSKSARWFPNRVSECYFTTFRIRIRVCVRLLDRASQIGVIWTQLRVSQFVYALSICMFSAGPGDSSRGC